MALTSDDSLTQTNGSLLESLSEVSAAVEQSAPVALPPLTISALMVTKVDLIGALRVYLPHLSDIEMIDERRFLLTLGPEHPSDEGNR